MDKIVRTTVLLRRVPRGLKDDYKACCHRRGGNMTADIIAHMKEVVRRDRIALGGKNADN